MLLEHCAAAGVGPISINGQLTEDDGRMADEFNDYLITFFGPRRKLKSGWQNYKSSWDIPSMATFIKTRLNYIQSMTASFTFLYLFYILHNS